MKQNEENKEKKSPGVAPKIGCLKSHLALSDLLCSLLWLPFRKTMGRASPAMKSNHELLKHRKAFQLFTSVDGEAMACDDLKASKSSSLSEKLGQKDDGL